MKIIEGMEIIHVDDTYTAVSTGEAARVFKGVIHLNRTGYEIWSLFEKNMNSDEIAKLLCDEYPELTYEKALEYVLDFSKKLIQKGILITD